MHEVRIMDFDLLKQNEEVFFLYHLCNFCFCTYSNAFNITDHSTLQDNLTCGPHNNLAPSTVSVTQ